VKNSVYVLPDREQSLEDFQWIRLEIVDGGGDASICRADFVDGLTDDEVRQLFRVAGNADYVELAAAARELHNSGRGRARGARRGESPPTGEDIARLWKRLATIVAIDFFNASERMIAGRPCESPRRA
jgi:hypothetical protein